MSPLAPALVSAIGWTLVNFIWQGVLLGCATAVALTVLRNARPEWRYAVACAALLACAAWPALDLAMRLRGAGASGAETRFADMLPGYAANDPGFGWLAFVQVNLVWIVGLWALCAAALGVRMALGLLWIGRVAQGRRTDAHWQARVSRLAEQFGVTRAVRVRIVDNLASPITAAGGARWFWCRRRWCRACRRTCSRRCWRTRWRTSSASITSSTSARTWSRHCCSITLPSGGSRAASGPSANRLQTMSQQGNWANRGAWPLRFPNWSVSSSQHTTWPRRPTEEISCHASNDWFVPIRKR